ncbi:MAG: enoyl-CoA hydratase/isomerase family protein [Hyphomonadaceae bacterium]|jgi:enoyl-CoA hydratase|nr:enoyl-CoA hydratase/isomerase family protein [Hyphomonadaceae bacterium]
MEPSATDAVLIRREGRAGRITMNRPKALNALTYGMVGQIWEALVAWQSDPTVELVLLEGAGDRALCAGGDVRSLYESRADGSGFARTFWRDEYRLNALIGRYRKPYVALQDGIVMGGGIGLSGHAAYRIVTERSQLAMPETGIGLIPDVGGTWLLAHAPGQAGLYLGLTGETMHAADAVHAGFSDSFLPSANVSALTAQLCDPKGGDVATVVARSAQQPGPSALAAKGGDIDKAFAGDTMEAILATLARMPGDWAAKTHATLMQKSPKAQKLTLAAIRKARSLRSLQEALTVEFRLTVRLFEDGEFPEGVRALIIDKDRAPKWSPPRLDGVADTLVEQYLAPLPHGADLTFEAGNR